MVTFKLVVVEAGVGVESEIDLNDGTTSVLLDGFAPTVPLTPDKPVRDSVKILLRGASALDRLHVLNRALDHARRNPIGHQGVWIYYAPDGTSWRSRAYNGAASYDEKLHSYYRSGYIRVTLTLEREPYWEGPEQQIPLSNGNGENNINGLTVINCNDGTGTPPNVRNNWVEVNSSDVDGDLPGPTRLEITNLDTTYRIYHLWIGQNWTDPANSVQVYEAENAIGETPAVDSSSSNGYSVLKSVPSGGEVNLFSWTITNAAMTAAQGQWVHALARFASPYWEVNTRLRLKLQWNVTTFWQSEQVLPGQGAILHDLFQFRLPPGRLSGSLDESTMILTGEQSSGINQNISLDYLALVPADGWRYLKHNGYGTAQGERVIDDGISGNLYRDNGLGTNRVAILSGYGDPIRLMPGKRQRLYFWVHSNVSMTAPISMAMSVKLFYRPRRASL